MPKVLGPDRNCLQIDVGGQRLDRQKDGTFHVDSHTAKLLKREGNFGRVGTKINGQGWRCQTPGCHFVSLLRDHCGRCGGSELVAE